MRKILSALMLSGLALVGISGVANASHNTTIVYNCPTNREGIRTNVTYTYPTWMVAEAERRLVARGCTKVSSSPTPH